jgi:uncharacterized protein (TIGR02466 family)
VLVTFRDLFVTRFYEGVIDDADLMAELEASIRMLAREDKAGKGWCKAHGYPGYTSYASLNDLPQRDPAFADLKRHLDRHALAFAKDAQFDLGGGKPKLDSLWVNSLDPGGGHSGHIHPHSIISGTLYIRVPPGAGALKLEDPRLPLMMAAPQRLGEAQPFHYAQPKKATLFLWESWLRHEVPPGSAKSKRMSISFNYR